MHTDFSSFLRMTLLGGMFGQFFVLTVNAQPISRDSTEKEAHSPTAIGSIRSLSQALWQKYPRTTDSSPAMVLQRQTSANGCELPDQANGIASNRVTFLAAEDFAPEFDSSLSALRWWGAYSDGFADCQGNNADAFEVRYYADEGGRPGPLIGGPFSQLSGTLTVNSPVATGILLFGVLPEYEFVAVHNPISVNGGQCYWVEISNALLDCAWFWETTGEGNGRSMQDGPTPNGYDAFDVRQSDLAFCVNFGITDGITCLPVTPDNNDCVTSLTITDGDTPFDSTNCTTDGPSEQTCNFSGDNEIKYDLWFDYIATCSSTLTVRLCASTFDTRLAVYTGSNCPPLGAPLACDDDRCGNPANRSLVSLAVTLDQTLKIRVGSAAETWGVGQLTITCGQPPVGSCCTANGTPGCSEASCRDEVCACDPFCCLNEWDEGCAVENQLIPGCDARSLCASLCGESECCFPHGTPGCADIACETAICACDPLCCTENWDFNCAVRNSRIPGCEAPTLCAQACSNPCPNRPDLNGNARVDLGEVSWLIGCMQGPTSTGNGASCMCSDYDGDGDVDLKDCAGQQVLYSGP